MRRKIIHISTRGLNYFSKKYAEGPENAYCQWLHLVLCKWLKATQTWSTEIWSTFPLSRSWISTETQISWLENQDQLDYVTTGARSWHWNYRVKKKIDLNLWNLVDWFHNFGHNTSLSLIQSLSLAIPIPLQQTMNSSLSREVITFYQLVAETKLSHSAESRENHVLLFSLGWIRMFWLQLNSEIIHHE